LKTSLIVLVILSLGGALGFWKWHAGSGQKVVFSTAVVKRGSVVATISATGTVEPIEVIDVGAQVAGRISSFGVDNEGKPIDYGSIVAEGAMLAKIDDSVYAADLSVAKAQLEQSKAGEQSALAGLAQSKVKLVQNEAEWKRAEELGSAKLLSLSLFESAKADYEIAKANVAVAEAAVAQSRATAVQARAAVDKAQRNLDFCTIKSPVRGVIIDRRVNIGQTVVASLNAPSLFLIAKDLTRMQIWVAVNEADIGRVLPGAPVTFVCDAFPGREFKGTVGKIRLNATMTQNVVMYTVEVNTENSDKVLLPYLTANVRFVVGQQSNSLVVPNAALRWSPSSLTQIAPEARGWKPADVEKGGIAGRPGVIWTKEGEFVRPLEVRAGTSDGMHTAILGDELQEGREIVTGELVESSSAPATNQNPFLPVVRKR